MNEKDKKQIKDTVIKQLSELEEDIRQLEEAAKPIAPDNAYGRLSRMDAINNKAIVDASLASKRATLQSYKTVLAKIDTEHYGRCRRCGNAISRERLLYVPDADYCIACAAEKG